MTQKATRPGARNTGAAIGRRDRTQDIAFFVRHARAELDAYTDPPFFGSGYGRYVGQHNPTAVTARLQQTAVEQRVGRQIREVLTEAQRQLDLGEIAEAGRWTNGAGWMILALVKWQEERA
ncbi:hypothetical protein [Nocardia camponoti]|uniref:Uncharacterized protein n=1 Tax=Nocardia camponoti TaxID=1616106 RepID=A0A917QDC3_9NOCA|nr:hypothetical protein [Nocardia camponoti]GGK44811.1 hypothetical protein GCM10011591_15520 [Nocardia camponoti]